MQIRTLRVFGATLCVAALCSSVVLRAGEAATPVKSSVDRGRLVGEQASTIAGETIMGNAGRAKPAGWKVYDLPPGTVFKTMRLQMTENGAVEAPAGSVAAIDERLIYSNTHGFSVLAPGPNSLVADDIGTTTSAAQNSCRLSRFTFQVSGNADNRANETRPYRVDWALYDTCPVASDGTPLSAHRVGGSSGSRSISTNDPFTVEALLSLVVVRPPGTFWLGLTFNRDNAGVVFGSPATEGFSQDALSSQGAQDCGANLGGFPDKPHASFNAEVFGFDLFCPPTHLEYRNARADAGVLALGADEVVVDDLHLFTNGCMLTGYEIAVKNISARYDLELRNGCSGPDHGGEFADWFPNGSPSAIPGTYGRLLTAGTGGATVIRVKVDPPVHISDNVFIAVKTNTSLAGPVITGINSVVGTTSNVIFTENAQGLCLTQTPPVENSRGAMQVSVTCEGAAPLGACCDLFIKECDSGPNQGTPCFNDAACGAGAFCDPKCRQLTDVNCTFPVRTSTQRPRWQIADACDPDPFGPQIQGAKCGQAACCFQDIFDVEQCSNLFERECDAVSHAVDTALVWKRGRFCDLEGFTCPLIACLERPGDCKVGHDTAGCSDDECCTQVCGDLTDPFRTFCCFTVWDPSCAELAQIECTQAPGNDECSSGRVDEGAAFIVRDQNNTFPQVALDTRTATKSTSDPLVCCIDGKQCADGTSCLTDADCPGTCNPSPPIGEGTVWFKFVADDTSIQIDTCNSNPQSGVPGNPDAGRDSSIEVFAAGDGTSDLTACNSLSLIGCNDTGCAGDGFSEFNAKLCLQNLVVGDTYYIMVSSRARARGLYRLRLSSPCGAQPPLVNDFCEYAEPVTDTTGGSPIPLDFTDATLQCPAPADTPNMTEDVWFEYNATCTGIVTVDTCQGGNDTSVVVYEGCSLCPDFETAPLAFNDDSAVCGSAASSVEFSAEVGDCYRIRVGNQSVPTATSSLSISCSPQCAIGPLTWVDPPVNTTDPGRPHLPNDATQARLGIDTIVFDLVPDDPSSPNLPDDKDICWELCETFPVFVDGTPDPNEILSISPEGVVPNRWVMTLKRPITLMATTTLRYKGNPFATITRLRAHPGNVNGSLEAKPEDDIFRVGDFNNLVTQFKSIFDPNFPSLPGLQGEPYSLDIDRSGIVSPIDLLDLVDLFNGAEAYDVWDDTIRPSSGGCPPQ